MSVTVRGNTGSGFVEVYDAPQDRDVTIQTLKFQVDTDGTAGVHAVRVRLVAPTVGAFATLDDLNVGGPGERHYYTFGIGLNASACTISGGMAVTDALPWTQLPSGGSITVTATDGGDNEIVGDAISNVVLQVGDDHTQVPPLLPILEMPAAAAV